MKRFTTFVSEATEFKNVHLPHLEDLSITAQGAVFALNVLRQLGEVLHAGGVGALNISVKWDGAPSVVFGPDPKDGGFFVGTKSVFNQAPKMAKSHVDIDALYPPSVTPVLHVCFDRLQTLHPGIVLQGDVLFTKDTLGTDEKFWTFKPNTLKYRVPKDSELGHAIDRKELGIVLHTMYLGTGQSLQGMSGVPLSPDTYATLRHDPSVLALDAHFDDLSGAATFTPDEHNDYLLALSAAEMAFDAAKPTAYALASELGTELPRFINWTIRTRNPWEPHELVNFLFERKDAEAAKRKTDAGKQSVIMAYTELIQHILDNGPAIMAWMDLHATLAKAKTIIVHKLASAVPISTTVSDVDGERTVGPEGFVVTTGNVTVKLIDRKVFSRINLQTSKYGNASKASLA